MLEFDNPLDTDVDRPGWNIGDEEHETKLIYAGPEYGMKSREEYNELLQSGALGRGQQAVSLYGKRFVQTAKDITPDKVKDVFGGGGHLLRDFANSKVGKVIGKTWEISGLGTQVKQTMNILGAPVDATHWVSKKVDHTGRGIGKAPLAIAETVATLGAGTAKNIAKQGINKVDDVVRATRLTSTNNLAYATVGVDSRGLLSDVAQEAVSGINKPLAFTTTKGLISSDVENVLGKIPVKSNASDKIGEIVNKSEAIRKQRLIDEGKLKLKPKNVTLDSAEAVEKFYGMTQKEMRSKFGFRFKNKSTNNKTVWGLESLEVGKAQLRRRTERILEVTDPKALDRGLDKIKAIQKKGMDPHHIVPTHISKKIKDSLSPKQWQELVKADAARGIYHGNHPRNLVAARHSTKVPTTTAGKKSEIFHRKGKPEEALTGYHTLERRVESVKDYHQFRDFMAKQMKTKRQATKFLESLGTFIID